MNQLTSILAPVMLALVSAAASVAIVVIANAKTGIINWLHSHATAKQQAVIDAIAKEAFAYAEKRAEGQGAEKLNKAAVYMSNELQQRGIDITSNQLHAAIQSAWMEFNKGK
jgi:LL-H family phage holin